VVVKLAAHHQDSLLQDLELAFAECSVG